MPVTMFKSSSLLGHTSKSSAVELGSPSSSEDPKPSKISNSNESGDQTVRIETWLNWGDKRIDSGISEDRYDCGHQSPASKRSSRRAKLKRQQCGFEDCNCSFQRSDNLKVHRVRKGHFLPSDPRGISSRASEKIGQRSSDTVSTQQIRSTNTSQGFNIQESETPTMNQHATSSETSGPSENSVEERSMVKNVVAWIEPTSDKYRIQNPVTIPVTNVPVAKSHNADEKSESEYKDLSIEFTDTEEEARFQREIQRIQRLHTSKRLSGGTANETPIQKSEQVSTSRSHSDIGALNIENIAAGAPDNSIRQAVQGGQAQFGGPGNEPWMKSEFGRMFSVLLGSAGNGLGSSNHVPTSAQSMKTSNSGADDADLNNFLDGDIPKLACPSNEARDEIPPNVESIFNTDHEMDVQENKNVSSSAYPSWMMAAYHAAVDLLHGQTESFSVPQTPSRSVFVWQQEETNSALTLNEVIGSRLTIIKPSEKNLRCIYEESDLPSNKRKGKRSMFVLGDPSDGEEDSADDTTPCPGAEETLATTREALSDGFETLDMQAPFSSKRRDSGTWSITSLAESVFSLESGMTRSTASSLNTPQELIERLVGLFLEDNDFQTNCLRALDNIRRERFERNLRKLLIIFASQLRAEAKSENERNAARFVKHRATNSAHLICSKLNRTENVRFQKAVGVQEEVDEADDESESDRSEGDIDNLLHLETFIKTSASLIFLKTALELYVHNVISNGISNKATTGLECPAASQAGMNKVGDKLSLMVSKLPNIQHYRTLLGIESQLDPEKKQAIILDAQKQLRSYFNLDHRSDDRDDPTLSWLEGVTRNSIVAMPTQQHFAGTELSKRVLASEGWRKCTLLLEQLEIIRPELQFGKTRIEWKCKCGHTIYDDFTELKPGAAERYRNMLDSSKIATNGEKSHSTATTRNSMSGFIQAVGKLCGTKKGQDTTTLPTHTSNSSSSTSTCTTDPKPSPSHHTEPLYLLLCYPQGRYATRLLQLDLTQKAFCDKTLFTLLRQNYISMRGKYLSLFSFRILHSIKFVQFDLYKSYLVDVRKENVIPSPNNLEYRYLPAPPELVPPVGERHLMHLFEHPDHAEDEAICFDRFPKKLREKLACERGINPGWGLQFVEGWDGRKVWGVVFVMFGVGSLVIAVLWSVFGHSIQDAFTMASYAVAMGMVSLGTLQAFLVG